MKELDPDFDQTELRVLCDSFTETVKSLLINNSVDAVKHINYLCNFAEKHLDSPSVPTFEPGCDFCSHMEGLRDAFNWVWLNEERSYMRCKWIIITRHILLNDIIPKFLEDLAKFN